MTTEDAKKLIDLLKKIVKGSLIIPEGGKSVFEFKSVDTRDEFLISIFNSNKSLNVTYAGLLKGKNVMLLRLDIKPNGVHMNPDGKKVLGSHIHVYCEEYQDKFAVEFDVDDEDVYENCLEFFKQFNIVETTVVYNSALNLN